MRHFVAGVKARVMMFGTPRVGLRNSLTVARTIDEDFLTDVAITYSYKAEGGAIPVKFEGEVGADGSIIREFLDWLTSPEGMAFIKFIFSLFGFVVP